MSDKRTVEETIKLFKQYAYDYSVQARRCEDNDKLKSEFYYGKADAYEMAAFELEHNMMH